MSANTTHKGNSKTCQQTLGLVITDGVGFRNFILSDFLKQAKQKFARVVIFSALPKKTYKDVISSDIIVFELPTTQEKGTTWFFRKAKEIAHLRNNAAGNFGIEDNLKTNYNGGSSRRAKLTRLIYQVTVKLHSEKWIGKYYRLQQKSFAKSETVKIFEQALLELNPSVLFFTHQRPPYIAPLIFASEKKEIKTCSFIFSWDNLASKGRMAGDFDHYLVWSDLMRSELLQFYKKVSKEQISIVGTPQFEPYVMNQYSSSKEEFATRFDLDKNLSTICFSCGDVSTSANDPIYIETIAEAIQTNQLDKSVNFLVRTSPAEEPHRFRYVAEKFSFIKWNYPQWKQTRQDHAELWSQRVPTKTDLQDLRMILEYADLGINMCSTMSLDFMLFDKPIINPVFGNTKNGLYDDQRFLKYAHYQRVVESGAVAIAKTAEELIEAINFSLENPEARLTAQRGLIKLQIGKPLESTSEGIAEALKTLV
ncbi:hypothetical protein ACNKXS_00160 [Christiangramia marina]|uniref:hypothetical protein n=1 Tax=Christiangramia marina TaxID=409436 RepID=UPI003AA8F64A